MADDGGRPSSAFFDSRQSLIWSDRLHSACSRRPFPRSQIFSVIYPWRDAGAVCFV